MAYCFKKARTPVAPEGRNKVLPCISLTFIKAAQFYFLQSVLSCLNPSRLREVGLNPHSCRSFAWFGVVEASTLYELTEL